MIPCFVVYDSTGVPLWYSRTASPYAYLLLQGDGNLVIYSPDGAVVWLPPAIWVSAYASA